MVGSNFFRCNEEATDSSSISTTPKKIQKQVENNMLGNNFVLANVEEEAGDSSVWGRWQWAATTQSLDLRPLKIISKYKFNFKYKYTNTKVNTNTEQDKCIKNILLGIAAVQ